MNRQEGQCLGGDTLDKNLKGPLFKAMPWLLIAFFTVPLIEAYVLITVGQSLGVMPTIALIIFTAVLGASLARREGLRAWQRFFLPLEPERELDQNIFDAFAVFVGGALLLTPGFVTDAVGFSLLIPQSRDLLFQRLKHHLERHFRHMAASGRVHVASGVFHAGPSGHTHQRVRRVEVIESEDPDVWDARLDTPLS